MLLHGGNGACQCNCDMQLLHAAAAAVAMLMHVVVAVWWQCCLSMQLQHGIAACCCCQVLLKSLHAAAVIYYCGCCTSIVTMAGCSCCMAHQLTFIASTRCILLLPLVSVVHRGIMHAVADVLDADACCCSCCIFCHSFLFQVHCVTPSAHGCHGCHGCHLPVVILSKRNSLQ